MNSFLNDYIAKLRFNAQQLATLRALGEYRGKQQFFVTQSPDLLSDFRQVAVVESTESSSRMEGVCVATHRLKPLIVKNVSPQNPSEQEVKGYRDALRLIHDSGEKMPFSEGAILQLHGTLYPHMRQQGAYWKTANDIVERPLDGSPPSHFGPSTGRLSKVAMVNLVTSYNLALSQRLADPLVLVPLVILDFFCIHPFLNGNGRIARLLTLQLLYHFGYEVGRFISLERIFEESKDSYYETLEASSQHWHKGKHNSASWLDFFWGALLSAYKEFEERVGAIEYGRGAKGDRVRAEILMRNQPFSISEIEEACPGISRDMVRVVLRTIKTEGLIMSTGKGRSAKWKQTEGYI